MSNRSRIALLGALVAVAAGTFVVLQPGDDDTATTTTATTAAPTATSTAPATTPTATTPTATTGTPPAPLRIRVQGGQPVGGLAELTVEEGDRIRFTVTADAPEHVHLHGYDVEKPVAPGQPARFSVPATISGVFEIELEDSGVQIAELTVEP